MYLYGLLCKMSARELVGDHKCAARAHVVVDLAASGIISRARYDRGVWSCQTWESAGIALVGETLDLQVQYNSTCSFLAQC